MSTLLSCIDVSKHYNEGSSSIQVLDKVNFEIQTAEQVAILGSSGSGKSTLLHLLGALDRPSAGKVLFKGNNIFDFSEAEQARFRNRSLGFVYQFHHLLPEFSAAENVAMPLLIGKLPTKESFSRAKAMLNRVGLSHRESHKPSQMSGGERQRVAIARALVTEPDLVLADEPTGNLDHKTGMSIYALISELREQMSTSFIVVTHDTELAERLDRTLHIIDGKFTTRDPAE